jgi:hypothetical protein
MIIPSNSWPEIVWFWYDTFGMIPNSGLRLVGFGIYDTKLLACDWPI